MGYTVGISRRLIPLCTRFLGNLTSVSGQTGPENGVTPAVANSRSQVMGFLAAIALANLIVNCLQRHVAKDGRVKVACVRQV